MYGGGLMQILFVTSEVAPYSQTNEVARVCASLPKALQGLGHSVTVLSPLYKGIEPAAFSLARRLSGVTITLGGRTYDCELYDGRTASGVNVLFLGNREHFSTPAPLSAESGEMAALGAALLSRTAIEVVKNSNPPFQIVHAYDWLAALTICWAKRLLPATPRLLSLHDPRKQGRFDAEIAARIGLDAELAESARTGGELNFLKSAIQEAHFVVTNAQATAAALTREGGGYGLESSFRALEGKLTGIANGIDASIWNPLTDVHLKSRYHPNDLAGKQRCKAAFQHEIELPLRADIPLFTVFGSLDWEHGGDLLAQAAERALHNDIQIAVVCDEHSVEQLGSFRDINSHFPDRIKVRASNEQALKHRAISGSDFVLIPSRSDECGALSMAAQRYGALPIARQIGSIEDTVVDCDSKLESGSGFLFETDEADEFLAAIQRATAAFTNRKAFESLRRRVMRMDNSWDRSARRYDLLYKNLAAVNGLGTDDD
jgi:starch synthase